MQIFKIPAFLLSYLINGTTDNLDEQEIKLADKFLTKNNITSISPDDTEHFSGSNDVSNTFGGCMIVYCECLISE